MSRIGKKPILIPEGVTVELKDSVLYLKGPLGEDSVQIPSLLKLEINDTEIKVLPAKITKQTSVLWGTTRSLINSCIEGVTRGFSKKLILKGVGYKISKEGQELVLKLGYINSIHLPIPEGVEVEIEKDTTTVKGISKPKVTQFAAKIKSLKPVEPYKGKGFHYEGEEVRRKSGKKLAGTTA